MTSDLSTLNTNQTVRRCAAISVCLVWLAAGAAAQEHRATGPLARAIANEAVPLAAPERHAVDGRQVAADTDWARVTQLAAGDAVRVVLGDGASYQGTFRVADEESVTIQASGVDRRLLRDRVRRLSVARGSSRRRHVLIGLAIGGATSALAVGLSCRGQDSSCKEAAPAYFYPLAGAGAAIGAVLPAKNWRDIYLRSEF